MPTSHTPTTARRPLTRRRFIGSLCGVAGLTALYTWRVEPHWLEVTHCALPVRGLPPLLEGKTVVQLSDLHVGRQVDDNYLIGVFETVRALAPDFVAATGDWVSYRDAMQSTQLARLLEHFPHGKLGTVGILGNHDWGKNWSRREVSDRITKICEDAGIRILRNAARRFEGLQFIGLDDLWGRNFHPEAVLATHGSDPASIVLCHNPDAVDRPVWGDYDGWILAGHTHGGQCKPPFLPPPLLPVANRRYAAGQYALAGNRTLYISRGIGHLIRVRFNVRPEVVVFTLTTA